MHQDDILILQIVAGTVDRIDVVGLVVDRILHKGDMQRKIKAVTIADQHAVECACRHDDLGDARFGKHRELSAQDRLPGRDLCHTFRMLTCQNTHPGAKPGVQDQRFHCIVPFHYWYLVP